MSKMKERANEGIRVYGFSRGATEMTHYKKTGTTVARGKRIPGMAKFGRLWLIRKDIEQPMDKRQKHNG